MRWNNFIERYNVGHNKGDIIDHRSDQNSQRQPHDVGPRLGCRSRGMKTKIQESAETAISVTVRSRSTASIPNAETVCFPTDICWPKIAHLLEKIEDKFVENRDSRPDSLLELEKNINMRRNHTVNDYMQKHRVLRYDMTYAGYHEVLNENNEKKTVNHIIEGLKENGMLDSFRTSLITTQSLGETSRASMGMKRWRKENHVHISIDVILILRKSLSQFSV